MFIFVVIASMLFCFGFNVLAKFQSNSKHLSLFLKELNAQLELCNQLLSDLKQEDVPPTTTSQSNNNNNNTNKASSSSSRKAKKTTTTCESTTPIKKSVLVETCHQLSGYIHLYILNIN